MPTHRGLLSSRGISSSDNNTTKLFESLFSDYDFTTIPYESPKDYVLQYWNAYVNSEWFINKTSSNKSVGATNGKIFEYIIHSLLIREGIVPFYTQARVTFVPAINYDTILYKEDPHGHIPICLSLKTSLRERWKQADLEGEALKNVHRKAKCYLLTIEHDEVVRTKGYITSGDAVGIDNVIDCMSDEFNTFIEDLKQFTYRRSIQIDVVQGNIVL